MIFIDNKYTKWYNNIVSNARSRGPISGYTEKHHIIPKSMSGDNSKENLVKLTAREHFICHWLLTKMTDGKDKRNMFYAWTFFIPKHNSGRIRVTSSTFSKIKEAHSLNNTGDKNPMFNRTHTEATRSKQKLAKEKYIARCKDNNLPYLRQGLPQDTEARRKNSESNKNRPLISCEHCGLACQNGNYLRWHGVNCRHKP